MYENFEGGFYEKYECSCCFIMKPLYESIEIVCVEHGVESMIQNAYI